MKLSHSDHLDRKIYLLLRTYKYIYVFGDSMALKQISLTIPDELLMASKEYSKEFGYRNIQELILELIRNKVLFERIERYRKIEQDMIRGKNVKKFSQKDAVEYLKSL